MPTYAYRCADCGHSFDIYQSFTDESLTVCLECDGNLRKVFGSLGVTFNGSGFYRTDSRAEASSASSSSGSASTSSNASSPQSASQSSSSTSSAPAAS